MKLAYVTTFEPLDMTSWSGSSYHLAKSLENQSISLEYIGPLKRKSSVVSDFKTRLHKKLFKKDRLTWVQPTVLKKYAQEVSDKLASSDADMIFSLGTSQIAYLETKKPIVYMWDCTFSGQSDYPMFRNLSPESIKLGNRMEQLALDKCKLAIFSSEWAYKTAINNYEVDEKKVKVVPLGANIACNRSINDVIDIINSRSSEKCNLLFIGIDWFRKGGEITYKIAKELNRLGLETTLTIVGCQPEINETLPNFVKTLGFINKFESSGLQKIEKLLAESHFLIMPSMAESYGIVFCEASSFGTPSLATNIGGIPTAVKDGINGKLFSSYADVTEYCEYILDLFQDYSKYKSLALSSFQEYQSRLNWSVTSKTIKELLTATVSFG
ncbi:glycosyltransferase family 4 protein [Scytonema hofmannii FACHB-248]|uniref:Glycosyltransferase family 4 protein n=1 Tax=Scytonema hofmannii FACHB-248 TaxID=1842502 RepID=A0ABR8GQ09_9CYAN|nr:MULTISPECIES: glycosyltransferase family 4 protein [Nostocales]MBD2605243.1 glycosyltransferase family 4 protein [Scytonema hofmannii FACHB-248]